ncbi:MAG: hypothetical protein HN929_06540, partial [Chloroflexi bacterium]|nr:hypothetical protein [Chloroflexota bacterium]
MKRTIVLLVNILILQIILSACNLPIATVTAPQPSDEQINTNQTAEAQSQIVQQTLQAQNSGSNLTISDVQVSVNTFYYLNDTCGPTEVTISAKVTSSALITNAGVLRLFNGDQKGPNGGQADAMTPIGNDRYAFTMNKQTDDLDSILRDNYSLELILYAEDTAGNQVATGDWGDAVGDGQPWPLNPIQLQIPTLR